MLMFPAAVAVELLRFHRDFMAAAPDEVGSGLAFITAPPLDFVPEPVRGQPVVAVVCCYTGSIEAGKEAFRPLSELPYFAIDMVEEIPSVAVQRLLDDANPKGMQNYCTAGVLTGLPDEAIDALVPLATNAISPLSQIIVVPGGGAVARVDDNATAFGERSAPWNVHFLSMWPDPADNERNITHTRQLAAAMKPWMTGRTYLNYIGDEGSVRIEEAFGSEKYARLADLKRTCATASSGGSS